MGWLNGGVQYSGVVISHAGVCDPGSEVWWTLVSDRFRSFPSMVSRSRTD